MSILVMILSFGLLLPVPAEAAAQGGDETGAPKDTASTDIAAPIPEALEGLFAETGDDDQPIIGDKLRSYLSSLPAHAQRLFVDAVENEMISNAEHVRKLLSLKLDADKMELLLSDNCILCHTDEDMQEEETLFRLDEGPGTDFGPSHLSLNDILSDVHYRRGLSCSGCHGGAPTDTEMSDEIYERWPDMDTRHEDRTWIPAFCGRCHSNPAFMREYNPALPTDQVAKYRTSRHGELLLQKHDSMAAQCVSCHGVHGIRAPDSRLSKVHPQNIPQTCGRCHADPEHMAGYTLPDGSPIPTDQLAQYTKSVHGIALLQKGDIGAPACNDCHGNHAAMPPEVAYVSQVCRTCHAGNGSLFDGSQHKIAFKKHRWPECGQCHGKHDIAKTSDAMLGTEPGQLCHDCHSQYAQHNPRCVATADHLRETIITMADAADSFETEMEVLAEKGLDVEPLAGTLNELNDALRQSRSTIHAFDRSDFDEVAAAGLKAAKEGRVTVSAAYAEFGFRRRGLVVSLIIMGFLALILFLKIRQVEGKQRGG